MGKRKPSRPVVLPDDEWIGGIIAMPAYVTDRARPYRPSLAVWMDLGSRFLITTGVLPPGAPGTALADALSKALADPAHEVFGHRPQRVRIGDLAAESGIRQLFGPAMDIVVAPVPELDDVKDSLVEFQRKETRRARDVEPSYLYRDQVDPALVGGFFEAAGKLWKAAPWKNATDSQIVRLSVPALGLPSAAVSIMGMARKSYGLLMFESLEGYLAHLAVAVKMMDHPGHEPINDMGSECISVTLEPKRRLSATMRAEIKMHGWGVVAAEAYPVIWHVDRDAVPRPTLANDYRLAIAASNGIAQFVAKHSAVFAMSGSESRSKSMRINVPVPGAAEPISVSVTAPHPGLDR